MNWQDHITKDLMTHLERLQGLLRELFQFDVADLDFGLYRLLHLKRQEVEAFLTGQLPRQVDEAFVSVARQQLNDLHTHLAELTRRIKKDVADDAIAPTGDPNPAYSNIKIMQQYQDIRRQLASIESTEFNKAEVFNHLYSFFLP